MLKFYGSIIDVWFDGDEAAAEYQFAETFELQFNGRYVGLDLLSQAFEDPFNVCFVADGRQVEPHLGQIGFLRLGRKAGQFVVDEIARAYLRKSLVIVDEDRGPVDHLGKQAQFRHQCRLIRVVVRLQGPAEQCPDLGGLIRIGELSLIGLMVLEFFQINLPSLLIDGRARTLE